MGVDSPLSYSHVVSGLAKSKESNVDVSFDNDILTPLDPPPFDLQLDPPPHQMGLSAEAFCGGSCEETGQVSSQLPLYL
jgi:hypothetical protein